jgi:hypothetical protein
MTDALTVTQAISRVIAALPAIGKDGKADSSQGGYAYRGIEQITQGAQKLFGEHGVIFVPKVVKVEIKDLTVNNKPWTDTCMEVEYTVYGPGGDSIVVGPLFAIGRDNSDKGANKAMTQAFKQALLQTLCISDAKDDNDGKTNEADSRLAEIPPFQSWGYKTDEAFRSENDAVRALWHDLSDEQREPLKDWLKTNGYDRPVPVLAEHVTEYRKLLTEAKGDVAPTAPSDAEAKPGVEDLEMAFTALPEAPRKAARKEVRLTFGEVYEMDDLVLQAAIKMVKTWPKGTPEEHQVTPNVPEVSTEPPRSAKVRGLIAYARSKGVEEPALQALVAHLDGVDEQVPLGALRDDLVDVVTALVDSLLAGEIVATQENGRVVIKEAVPA